MSTLNEKLKNELSECCREYEIVIAATNETPKSDNLMKLLKNIGADPCFVKTLRGSQDPVLVLGMRHEFTYDEAIQLLACQPDNHLLLYKRIDYVAYQKGKALLEQAKDVWIEYFNKMYPHIPATGAQQLDEDQSSIMQLINGNDDDVSAKCADILFGEDKEPIKADLPY